MTAINLNVLRERLGEIADLAAASALLEWDMEVMMPPRGAEARTRQLATLATLAHRLGTSADFARTLEALEARADDFSPTEVRLLEEVRYDFDRSTRLPERFVRARAEAEGSGYNAWVQARADSDFARFRPCLERLVDLQREEAELLGYEGSPYNALLEKFERGMTAEQVRPLFRILAERQSALVARIVEAGNPPRAGWLDGPWDFDAQRRFSHLVLRDMGYDFEAGRLDASPHPFTTSFDIDDVRITTRYHGKDLFSALLSSMHEGGHALYDQGFEPAWRRTPLAQAPSLGIHELNSRLWENLVGRSKPFWTHYLPVLREHFPGFPENVSVDEFLRQLNRVEPSLIRVEADECTYNLHVILRFELEVDLIEGRLAAADLPEAWNAKMKSYLGIDVPDDAHGCLQDVHWSQGMMGYFPTYALGNLYSAQTFETIQSEMPNLSAQISRGRMLELREWLRVKIHHVGRLKTAPVIVEEITGRKPGSDAYLRYLESKYGELYGIG